MQMTDPLEKKLDRVLPDDAEGRKLRKKFKLGLNATWRDAVTEARLRKMLDTSSVYEDFTDRVEGRAADRLVVSGPENKDITIHVVTEESPTNKE